MERFGLAGLLVLVVPSLAAAQRIEVVAFAGGYTPVNRVQSSGDILICDTDPCPFFYRRVTRPMGLTVGGRMTAQFTPRFAIDGTAQRVRVTHKVSTDGWTTVPEQVTLTFFAVQPRLRLHVDDRVEGFVAAGPALAIVDAVPANPAARATHSGTELGLAFSAGLRVPIAGALALELRANDYVYTAHAPEPQMQHDLTYSLGLAFTSVPSAAPPVLGQGPAGLARAAARTTITPAVGAYVSLGSQAQWTVGDSVFGPTNGESHRMTLEPGVSTGVRVGVQSTSWWGVEVAFTTAAVTRRDDASMSPTAVLENPDPPTPQRALGRNSVGALRMTAMRRLGAWGEMTIAAGPALVVVARNFLRWDNYRPLIEDHIWGASLGATLGIAPTRGTRVELGVTDQVYAMRFDARNPRVAPTSFVQHDLVMSAGFAVKVGR